jgi:hypothetical protein
LLLLVALLSCARLARADCDNPFGDPDQVLDFHLRTTTEVWKQFQSSDKSDGCDEQYPYFPAEFRCGEDEPYIALEFRRKRDRSQTSWKLPIKLDFNRAVAGQRWPAARGKLGYRKLSLNSGQSDDAGRSGGGRPANPGTLSALLTEHLAWRLMRQELPESSGVAYARLTLHFTDTDETRYQGLYVLIEDIDRTAVRARFGSDEGLLVKTTDLGCVDEVVFDDGPPNSASELFSAWLSEDPNQYAEAWYARTNQALHLDPLLRQEALRELLANTGDTVLGNRNNYFALDLRGERRHYLPWDLDDMFRPFPQVRAATTPLFHACVGGAGCTPNKVGLNTRDQPEIRRQYLENMCQLSNGVAQEEKLLSEFEALDALVRPIVAEEVEPLWAPVGRNPLDASVEGTYASEVERMKKWIPDRVRAVRTLIEAEGVACPEGCEEGARVACEASGREGHRVCTSARWGACSSPDPVGGAGGESGAGGATNTGVDSGGSDGGGSPGVAGETGITSAGSPGNGGSAIESGGQSGASAGGAGPGGATGEAGNDNVNPGAPRKESGGCVLGRRADSADEAGAWLLLFAMSLRSTRRKRRVEEVHRRSSW